jgi:hypothetical protein
LSVTLFPVRIWFCVLEFNGEKLKGFRRLDDTTGRGPTKSRRLYNASAQGNGVGGACGEEAEPGWSQRDQLDETLRVKKREKRVLHVRTLMDC